jgi:ParB family chromosome partitioning protein
VAEWVARNAITVRETEAKVRALLKPEGEQKTPREPSRDIHVAAIEEQLRDRFGTRATVVYRKGRGSVALEFYGDDDLNRILELLGLQP